jgi:hypothetical protein
MPAKKKAAHRPAKHSPEVLKQILNFLVLTPRLNRAALDAGIHPTTLFDWLGKSNNNDPAFEIDWLGRKQQFAVHVLAARKLNVVALDHSARDMAINGWREYKTLDGKPVWRVDAKLAADALDPGRWKSAHGDRPITDIYLRDENGALIQDYVDHPPNPQLLNKMLASLAPEVYGDKSTVEHVGTVGHVWVGGEETKQIEQQRRVTDEFGMTTPPDPQKRATNTLAVPAPCKTSEEFDAKFMRKLVREVILFRDVTGKLEPPLDDDLVVEGSWQHREFVKQGMQVRTVTAASLIEAGYTNDFLYTLAPEAPHKKPTADDLYVEKEGDSELVRDMKRRAREGIKTPMSLDQVGNQPVARARDYEAADDTRDPATGQPTRRIGEGREFLGRGAPPPGGYNVDAARPRRIIR